MIAIMEEADWIQAERILDVDTRSKRDEAMDRRMMAVLEAQMLALKVDDTERQEESSDEGWEVRDNKQCHIQGLKFSVLGTDFSPEDFIGGHFDLILMKENVF